MFNGILYVLTTDCIWHDVPANYGIKSTVHRYHLELCEKSMYQMIFLNLLQSGYEIQKTRKIRDFPDKKLQGSFRIRSLAQCDGYQEYPSRKGGSAGYDGCKKINGNKQSALIDRNGLPLACTVSPANVHDSRLYEPTLKAFGIPEVQDHSAIILADAAY